MLLPWIKYAVLATFVVSAAFVHLRGRDRHGLLRQVTDHSTFMAPYNALMYLFSAVPAKPYLDVSRFPELDVLREHWQVIRDEALGLSDEGHIRAAMAYNDLGFNSFYRHGWKRFYLKWYDDFLPSAKVLCPRTIELIRGIPTIKAAMFAMLPAGSRLGRHRDPFAGSLRYHLGLVTPNSDECRIFVDGEPYAWHDGEAVMFDETYIHHAENRSATDRLILFCDVERPLRTRFMRAVNHVIGWRIIRGGATRNVEGEHVSVPNRLFGYAYQVRLVGKRIKARSRVGYYALKWALIGGLVWLLFF